MALPLPSVGALWALWHRRPDLLLEHADAYADLLRQEASEWAAYWLGRVLWLAAAALLGAVGLTLAGVAVLLAGAVPQRTEVLVAVPALVFFSAAVCAWLAQRGLAPPALEILRAQWDADRRMLAPQESSRI
jgi:uncharacterized membrane protein YqjE